MCETTSPILISVFRRLCWKTSTAQLFRILVGSRGIDPALQEMFNNNDYEGIMSATEIPFQNALRRIFHDFPPTTKIRDIISRIPNGHICRTRVHLAAVTAEQSGGLFRAHGWESGEFQQTLFDVGIGDNYLIPYTGILVRKSIPRDMCELDYPMTMPSKQIKCPQCGHEFSGG